MRPCSPALLLALLVLVTSSAVSAQPAACQTTVRRIELGAGAVSPPEVCISPGLSTTLLFDRPLARDAVLLEGRERFQRLEVAGSLLVLVPSEKLEPGERLRLKVRFTPPDAPESATFVLVVHREEAERQVEISRASRPPDSCLSELQRTEVELQRKEVELQRCLAARPSPASLPDPRVSLAALLSDGAIDASGLTSQLVPLREFPAARTDTARVKQVTVYRSIARLVVAVQLAAPEGMKPWQAVGASLVRPSGEALQAQWLVQPRALTSGERESVWMEVDIPSDGARGSYTLELWDEARARTITVPGVRFP
ncbi:DUF2381 family protein [Hyalangium gracile]|uniref:DUF2381 family protein n=1 Tax=Hyalangium gracile TaxID=394092 RepID=UPI001CCDF790|nr:DUF2381 family protein [Hyalangium gracile]